MPHCSVEGHVGSCGGWGFGGIKIDEVLSWTGEGSGDRASAGKAKIPGTKDESATVKTTVSIMVLCSLRRIVRCRSKT